MDATLGPAHRIAPSLAVIRSGPGDTVRLHVLRDSDLVVLDVAAGDREAFYR